MKALALTALLAISVSCMAGSEMPCDKIEYARLKDSDRKELNEMYCRSMQRAKLNEDLGQIKQELFRKQMAMGANASATQADIAATNGAQVSCLAAAEDSEAIMKKKFKSKPQACK